MKKKSIIVVFNLGTLMSLLSIFPASQNDFKAEIPRFANNQLVQSDETQETIVSYVAVLDSYYDLAIGIPSKGQSTVEISENWFATSITVSYIVGGRRIITYADELSTNGSLNAEYNIIDL